MKTPIPFRKTLLSLLAMVSLVAAQAQEIALMPKGSRTNFWQIYIAGANQAAKELGVEISERSPATESQVDAQLKIFEFFVGKGVKAIVLTPLDKEKLVAPVEAAAKAGIVVIVTDSALASDVPPTFIGSDNTKAGELAGEAMAKMLGPDATGSVLNLRYIKGSASTDAREDGALAKMKAGMPNVTIIDDVWGGVVLGDIKRVIDEQIAAHADLKGIVTTNTLATVAAYKSIKGSGKAGQIALWGSGVNDELLEGLRDGTIQGLYVQNPYEMGYQGVKAAVAALKGETLAKRISTDVVLLTKENMDDPSMQKLLHP